MAVPNRVFVVVDRDYGERLAQLAEIGPVWIVDTPANRSVAEEIWATHRNRSHLEGVTTFRFPDSSSSEDILINELDSIDLHHGVYSANPPYTVLDVIGAAITARLRAELREFGFDNFQEIPHGFRAIRHIPMIRPRSWRKSRFNSESPAGARNLSETAVFSSYARATRSRTGLPSG